LCRCMPAGCFMWQQVQLTQITVTAMNTDQVRRLGHIIKALLKERHLKPDTEVTVPLDRLEEAERAKDRYKMLLVLIAGISLLVGGIVRMHFLLATLPQLTRKN